MDKRTREEAGRYIADWGEVAEMAKFILPEEFHAPQLLKEITTSLSIELNRRGFPLGALPAPGEESEGWTDAEAMQTAPSPKTAKGSTTPTITAGAARTAIFALINRRAMSRRSYAEMKQLEEQHGRISEWPDAVAVKFAQTMEEEKN